MRGVRHLVSLVSRWVDGGPWFSCFEVSPEPGLRALSRGICYFQLHLESVFSYPLFTPVILRSSTIRSIWAPPTSHAACTKHAARTSLERWSSQAKRRERRAKGEWRASCATAPASPQGASESAPVDRPGATLASALSRSSPRLSLVTRTWLHGSPGAHRLECLSEGQV